MKGLWSDEPFTHKGRFYDFEDMYMEAQARAAARAPLSGSGAILRGPLRRTARFGDGFMPTSITAATYARAVVKIERYAEEFRPGPECSITRAMHLSFRMGKSEAEASAQASEDMTNRMGRRVKIRPQDSAVGTVDDCLRSIERFYILRH